MGDIISFSSNTNYNLRSSARSDNVNSRFNTSYKKRAFSHFSMDVWNEIPTSIRDAKSIISFKKQFRQHLLNVQSSLLLRNYTSIQKTCVCAYNSYSNIILLLIHLLYFQTQQSSVSLIIIIFIMIIIIIIILLFLSLL